MIFATVVASRLLFHWLTGFTFDDAFITFRYARNIAAGLGFVFNEGERVLGTTTPLFTLIVAASARLGLPPVPAALAVTAVCSGITGVLIYRLGQLWHLGAFRFVPVVFYLFFPRLLATDTAGMETALFTLLVTATLCCLEVKRSSSAVGLAAIAFLTRPEGLLLVVLVMVLEGTRRPRQTLRSMGITMGVTLPWLIFAYFYFGSVIPNSVGAKLALYTHFGSASYLGNFVFLLGLNNVFGIIMIVLAVIGAWVQRRVHQTGGVALLWTCLLLAGYTFSRTHLFLWYPAPAYVFILLFAGSSIPFLVARIKGPQILGPTVITAVAFVLLLLMSVRTVRGYRDMQRANEETLLAIGDFLGEYARPDETVAGEDIGYMSFYSGRRFIDRDGLVTPEAIDYNRRGDYAGLIYAANPGWVVAMPKGHMSDFIDTSEFKDRYVEVRRFGKEPGPVYVVFKKQTSAFAAMMP